MTSAAVTHKPDSKLLVGEKPRIGMAGEEIDAPDMARAPAY